MIFKVSLIPEYILIYFKQKETLCARSKKGEELLEN